MAYTNIPDASIDLDSIIQEDWLEDLRDNVDACRVGVFGVDINEDTETSTTFATVANSTFYVHIPNVASYTGLQRTVVLTVQVHTTSTHTGTYRLYDVTNATAGTDEQTTTATAYEHKTLTINVGSGLVGTVVEYRIEMKSTSGGTAYLRAQDHITGRVNY